MKHLVPDLIYSATLDTNILKKLCFNHKSEAEMLKWVQEQRDLGIGVHKPLKLAGQQDMKVCRIVSFLNRGSTKARL